MANKEKNSKILTLTIVLYVMIVLVTAGGIAFRIHAERAVEYAKEIYSPEWIVGGLDENGAPTEATNSVYTKDAFECRELSIMLDADAEFTYQVFFYDAKGNFVEATEALEGSIFSFKYPKNVSAARILLLPYGDVGDLIPGNAVAFGKQLTITISMKQ